MDLATMLAIGASMFPWACHQHRPDIPVRRVNLDGYTAEADLEGWSRCEIRVDRDLWKWMDDDMKCTILAHERGHLSGLDHSDNPRSIMRPVLDASDRRCRPSSGSTHASASSTVEVSYMCGSDTGRRPH